MSPSFNLYVCLAGSHFCYFFFFFFFLIITQPQISTLFPYTTLFRSCSSFGACRNFSSYSAVPCARQNSTTAAIRSEEHTSELQSRFDLVCRLLLEKKN